ncbi:hypothetical protein AB0C47_21145 [Micromonospora taraxaci]|uniref:hypothetical protein n=1 Tax=Micromonospora taraxaci TaxID=1316803 RepID=UPI0033CC717B
MDLDGISPVLEKTLKLRSRDALRFLAQWQIPAGLRRAGEARIMAYLRQHGVRAAKVLTAKVLTAARTQTVAVAGEATASGILAQMAIDLEAVNDRITVMTLSRAHADDPERGVRPLVKPVVDG